MSTFQSFVMKLLVFYSIALSANLIESAPATHSGKPTSSLKSSNRTGSSGRGARFLGKLSFLAGLGFPENGLAKVVLDNDLSAQQRISGSSLISGSQQSQATTPNRWSPYVAAVYEPFPHINQSILSFFSSLFPFSWFTANPQQPESESSPGSESTSNSSPASIGGGEDVIVVVQESDNEIPSGNNFRRLYELEANTDRLRRSAKKRRIYRIKGEDLRRTGLDVGTAMRAILKNQRLIFGSKTTTTPKTTSTTSIHTSSSSKDPATTVTVSTKDLSLITTRQNLNNSTKPNTTSTTRTTPTTSTTRLPTTKSTTTTRTSPPTTKKTTTTTTTTTTEDPDIDEETDDPENPELTTMSENLMDTNQTGNQVTNRPPYDTGYYYGGQPQNISDIFFTESWLNRDHDFGRLFQGDFQPLNPSNSVDFVGPVFNHPQESHPMIVGGSYYNPVNPVQGYVVNNANGGGGYYDGGIPSDNGLNNGNIGLNGGDNSNQVVYSPGGFKPSFPI